MPPQRPKSLSSTRPPLVRSRIQKSASGTAAARTPTAATAARATRTIIRRYHVLQKELAQAVAKNAESEAAEIEKQIGELGGLNAYQKASLTGQKKERGGDSSKLLVEWLREGGALGDGYSRKRKRDEHADTSSERANERKTGAKNSAMEGCHVLEVGCLSSDNAISSWFDFLNSRADPKHKPHASIKRIDLNSQHPSILTQDFMERPLPSGEDEKFDLISLSLVLNYVPDAAGRGEMLRRTCQFLRQGKSRAMLNEQGKAKHLNNGPMEDMSGSNSEVFPALFLVLPAPCVENSRYLTEAHLSEIMASLGYSMLRRKISAKLVYYLWRWDGWPSRPPAKGKRTERSESFSKKEINPGKGRNNFCIVMK